MLIHRSAILATLICSSLGAQAEGLTLSAALDAAKLHDPRYQAALRESEASAELEIQGKAALGPDVSLAATGAQNQLDQTVGVSSRTFNYRSSNIVLQLRQPLYSAELQSRRLESEARSRQGAAVLAEQKTQLLLRLLEAYTNVLLADELLATAESEATALEEQLRAAQRLRRQGEGTLTEELEARSRSDLARAKILEARDGRQDAVGQLQQMVGPATRVEVRSLNGQVIPLPLQPAGIGEWELLALARNPSIEARSYALTAAREVLNRVDSARQPRIDLFASVSRAESDSVNTVNQLNLQKSIGVQLNMPIFDNGRIDSQTRQAVAGVGSAQAQLDYTRGVILEELRQHYRTLINQTQKSQAYAQALESAIMQVEATQKSVRAGVRVTLDVLNAQALRFSVQQELAKSRLNYFKAWFRLRAAAGVLIEPDMAVIDRNLK